MVVNEKALVRQMKESYKNQGYQVLVNDGAMVICNGFWLVEIDLDNVPNEVLSLIALHTRKIPDEGSACKVVKGDAGPIVQTRILEDALGPVKQMNEQRDEAFDDLPVVQMMKTNLVYDGFGAWQAHPGNYIYLIDPRYEALIADRGQVSMVGNGIYAEGEISKVWVLRVAGQSDKAYLDHLEKVTWVTQ